MIKRPMSSENISYRICEQRGSRDFPLFAYIIYMFIKIQRQIWTLKNVINVCACIGWSETFLFSKAGRSLFWRYGPINGQTRLSVINISGKTRILLIFIVLGIAYFISNN